MAVQKARRRRVSVALTLRRAEEADAKLLFRWANDPAVRAMARTIAPILWEGHRRWFAGKLADENCRIWIAEAAPGIMPESGGMSPAGQIRLDREGPSAEVDISVDPAARGRGVGLFMLRAMLPEPWRGLEALHAEVRVENAGSLALFRRGGFHEVRRTEAYVRFEKRLHARPR